MAQKAQGAWNEDLERQADRALCTLKDFQRATVDRVIQQFSCGQNRVLVADEVGLGKTVTARGIIAEMARGHLAGHDSFKVVYICSNQNIARQNLRKLNVFDTEIDFTDTRLSLQHLVTAERTLNAERQDVVQLISLTPDTSFRMTARRGGSVEERAVLYAVLSRMEADWDPGELERFLKHGAEASWNWAKPNFERRVARLEENSNGAYPADLIRRVKNYSESGRGRKSSEDLPILPALERRLKNGTKGEDGNLIVRLRRMFAELGVEMLRPDLVILDEFQRFPDLIHPEEDTEQAFLTRILFDRPDTRMLLMSATPYKLYSTLDEIDEQHRDEPYQEFREVLDFLLRDGEKQEKFHTVWSEYSKALIRADPTQFDTLTAKKREAEDVLYGCMCRTERLSAVGAGDLIDDKSAKTPMEIGKGDILSYLAASEALSQVRPPLSMPIDYVKSCPFPFSFLRTYKLRERMETWFLGHPQPELLDRLQREELWLDRETLSEYRELPPVNARLEVLKEHCFQGRSELYLWVPPSKPYYRLQGVYRGSEGQNYSKILVFSSWEMVPRMIGGLLSYEEERRTVGRLIRREQGRVQPGRSYFPDPDGTRFPSPRLTFRTSRGQMTGMNLFCLLYPARFLMGLYDPIACLNRGLSLTEIREEIRKKLNPRIEELRTWYETASSRPDRRWYYLTPFLLEEDLGLSWMEETAKSVKAGAQSGDKERRDNRTSFGEHLGELGFQICRLGANRTRGQREQTRFSHDLPSKLGRTWPKGEDPETDGKTGPSRKGRLGRMPEDLEQVLVDLVIGSPAICILRSNGGDQRRATELAWAFLRRFDRPEAIAVVELASRERSESVGTEPETGQGTPGRSSHWRNLLQYCVDGNFQSMLDEYAHMLREDAGFSAGYDHTPGANDGASDGEDEKIWETIHKTMLETLNTRTASYEFDTFRSFARWAGSVGEGDPSRPEPEGKLRAHFAVGFLQGEKEDEKGIIRKESIRTAFNSPLWPFVLSTTSIGQEGLDFHCYCRKVMHWNLPSNPIDLEQREGRINRYQCLALRQNLARRYAGEQITYERDVWMTLFDKAAEEGREQGCSDLVPYWCAAGEPEVKLERIVPMYPLSRDGAAYDRIIRVLSLYRLTLGQPRQEELLDAMSGKFPEDGALQELFLCLSPYVRREDRTCNSGKVPKTSLRSSEE